MRKESASSTTYSEISDISVNCRKRYVDHLKYISKLICLIHDPGHSSYECKLLGDFVYKYYKIIPTKYHRQEPATKNKFGRYQDNNAIVQHTFYYIIKQEKKIKCER